MKKLIAILIMTVMLVSLVPLALADEDTDTQDANRKIAMKQKNIEFKKYIEFRTTYEEDLKNTRKAWVDAKKSGDEQAMLDAAKSHLITGIKRMVAHLEAVKQKIASNKNYPEQASALEKIDARIAKLMSIATSVSEATTTKELKEFAVSAKTEWKDMNQNVKEHTKKLANLKLGKVADVLDKFSSRLDAKLEILKEDGADVSKYEDILAKANSKIVGARKIIETSNTVETLKTASEDLKDAKKLLQEVVTGIKGLSARGVSDENNAD